MQNCVIMKVLNVSSVPFVGCKELQCYNEFVGYLYMLIYGDTHTHTQMEIDKQMIECFLQVLNGEYSPTWLIQSNGDQGDYT